MFNLVRLYTVTIDPIDLLDTVVEYVSAVITSLNGLFNSVATLVWNSTTSAPTLVGGIIIFTAAAPLAMALFNWVVGLFKKATSAIVSGGKKGR